MQAKSLFCFFLELLDSEMVKAGIEIVRLCMEPHNKQNFFCDYKKRIIGILIRFCCFKEVFDQRKITLH